MSSPVYMIALDIGRGVDIASVKRLLAAGESDGRWNYEEGCVTDRWLQLP